MEDKRVPDPDSPISVDVEEENDDHSFRSNSKSPDSSFARRNSAGSPVTDSPTHEQTDYRSNMTNARLSSPPGHNHDVAHQKLHHHQSEHHQSHHQQIPQPRRTVQNSTSRPSFLISDILGTNNSSAPSRENSYKSGHDIVKSHLELSSVVIRRSGSPESLQEDAIRHCNKRKLEDDDDDDKDLSGM